MEDWQLRTISKTLQFSISSEKYAKIVKC